jgi:transcriptional regulator with XRE-family HTH domain
VTSSRIKAIRFFLKETPHEFAQRIRCDPYFLALLENGNIQPDTDIRLRLARSEDVLRLQGITTETIDRKEKQYEF